MQPQAGWWLPETGFALGFHPGGASCSCKPGKHGWLVRAGAAGGRSNAHARRAAAGQEYDWPGRTRLSGGPRRGDPGHLPLDPASLHCVCHPLLHHDRASCCSSSPHTGLLCALQAATAACLCRQLLWERPCRPASMRASWGMLGSWTSGRLPWDVPWPGSAWAATARCSGTRRTRRQKRTTSRVDPLAARLGAAVCR